MTFLNVILTLILNTGLPLAQVQVVNTIAIYAAPDFASEVAAKARPHDVLLIYQIAENWAQTEQGWFVLGDLPLEPAVVHFGATLISPIEIEPFDENGEVVIAPEAVVGVTAIFENRVLIYSNSTVGWVDLNNLQIIEPTPDLVDFVEQSAHIKVENANLYESFTDQNPVVRLPLGQEATLLYQADEWVLVRSRHVYGWGNLADFDIGLKPIARGETNASPINFYYPNPDGEVIELLDFRESILILGRDDSGNWLYLRRQGGLEGWSPAQYIDTTTEILDLPIIEGN